MKRTAIFIILLGSNLIGMDSDSETTHTASTEQEHCEEEAYTPRNVNINIMGFDPTTEEGKKKMNELNRILQHFLLNAPGPTVKSKESERPS